jgi:hypothetical protein
LTLQLSADGDIDIQGGRSKFASGLAGAALCAAARLEVARGELFWARNVGFPTLPNAFVADGDAVLGDTFDARRLREVHRVELMTVPGAVELTDFSANIDRATRRARPRWSLRVTFSDVTETVTRG